MTGLPRLAFEDLDQSLAKPLRATVERLGYFGEFFQLAAHAPSVLSAFLQYSAVLKTALPDDLNETIALTVCTRCGFEYERIQHERLSEQLGFSRDWIATLVGHGDESQLTALQRTVRALALTVAEQRTADALVQVERLAAHEGPQLAIASLFQASRFFSICSIGLIFNLQLPVRSIFDRVD